MIRKSIVTAISVLCLSSVVALAANLIRPTPLAWIRVPARTPQASSAAQQAPAPSSGGAAESKATAPAAEGVTTAVVLHHLASSTAHFVDAREPHEWLEGHLRGAIHIPSTAIYANIEKLVSSVPPNEKIIVYCTGGQCEASHTVAEALEREFKYQDVAVFLKGWEEISKVTDFKQYISTGDQP